MSTKTPLTRRMLRIGRVSEKTGMAESTIWRLGPLDLFPKPVKLSPGCTAWFEHEIDAWLDAKREKRDVVIARAEGGVQ